MWPILGYIILYRNKVTYAKLSGNCVAELGKSPETPLENLEESYKDSHRHAF